MSYLLSDSVQTHCIIASDSRQAQPGAVVVRLLSVLADKGGQRQRSMRLQAASSSSGEKRSLDVAREGWVGSSSDPCGVEDLQKRGLRARNAARRSLPAQKIGCGVPQMKRMGKLDF